MNINKLSSFLIRVAIFSSVSGPSVAQTVSAPVTVPIRSSIDSGAVEFPTEIYSIRPNSVTGPQFDLELPDGLSCSSENGTPPSLNFYGGSTQRDNRYQAFPDFVTEGYSLGAVFSIPLLRTKAQSCDEAYNLYLISKKIELLESLYDTGILSEAQVQSLSLKSLKELGLDVDDVIDMVGSVGVADGSEELESFRPEPFVVGP